MKKTFAVVYGYVCYILALGTILYLIGFIGNFWVPKSISNGEVGPVGRAVLVDLVLLLGFMLQHSGMARDRLKTWLSKALSRPFQRSTYVLASSLTLSALVIFWQPLPGIVWHVDPIWAQVILWLVYGLGWVTVFVSARLINSGHFFGVQQMKDFARDQPQTSPEFQTPGFYQYIRHPLMLGFLMAFWSTPHMTVGHLLFSGTITLYIIFAVRLEERDLIRKFGDRYRQYRERVPGFVPRFTPGRKPQGDTASGKVRNQ